MIPTQTQFNTYFAHIFIIYSIFLIYAYIYRNPLLKKIRIPSIIVSMDRQEQTSIKKDMISIDETAEILGISSATVKNWIKLQKLSATKASKTYLLNKETVLNLKENLDGSDLLKRRRNKTDGAERPRLDLRPENR